MTHILDRRLMAHPRPGLPLGVLNGNFACPAPPRAGGPRGIAFEGADSSLVSRARRLLR
jgi:hypothetical protein